MTATSPPTGLQRIAAEMARQGRDADITFAQTRAAAAEIAADIRRTGRLLLLGMGGSHWVNRTALFAYRRLGVEVQAEVLSEALMVPPPTIPRTVVLTSQSGDSGEIVKYLARPKPQERRFGLTLNETGALARGVPCLIAHGGMEQAFAATRSIVLSHTLHLAILSHLGFDSAAALAWLHDPEVPMPDEIIRILSICRTLIFTGRTELAGIAESLMLAFTELARRPALGLEGGQLRHGPMEMLSPDVAIIMLAAAGDDGHHDASLLAACRATGARTVVFDASDDALSADHRIGFAPASGYGAVMALLPSLLHMVVQTAARLVPNAGEPVHSQKVTRAL